MSKPVEHSEEYVEKLEEICFELVSYFEMKKLDPTLEELAMLLPCHLHAAVLKNKLIELEEHLTK